MKLLMFYVKEWWYKTAEKSLPEVPDVDFEESLTDSVVIFFHSEQEDMEKKDGVIQKCVKNIKWITGKFGTRNVVIHSFNHLSMSKSAPEFALQLADEVAGRLERAGFRVMRTPFGYFNEFRMHVGGDSLAKVYKEF